VPVLPLLLPQGHVVNVPLVKGGATNLKIALESWGVNIAKTLKFEKGGGCITPPSPMVVPPLLEASNIKKL